MFYLNSELQSIFFFFSKLLNSKWQNSYKGQKKSSIRLAQNSNIYSWKTHFQFLQGHVINFAKICPTLKDISHGFLSLLAFLLTNQALKQINFWLILQIIWSNFDIWNLWNLTRTLLFFTKIPSNWKFFHFSKLY